MIIEIQAKTLLSHSKQPDPWFGIKYGMNIYRGCEHQCIYCDSRSECYQIENFKDVLVKVNALELLEKELPRKRTRGTIGTGSMSDPYTPAEKRYNLTGRALEIIARHVGDKDKMQYGSNIDGKIARVQEYIRRNHDKKITLKDARRDTTASGKP